MSTVIGHESKPAATPSPATQTPAPADAGYWPWLRRTVPTAGVVVGRHCAGSVGAPLRLVAAEVFGADWHREGRSRRLVRRAQRARVDLRRVQPDALAADEGFRLVRGAWRDAMPARTSGDRAAQSRRPAITPAMLERAQRAIGQRPRAGKQQPLHSASEADSVRVGRGGREGRRRYCDRGRAADRRSDRRQRRDRVRRNANGAPCQPRGRARSGASRSKSAIESQRATSWR